MLPELDDRPVVVVVDVLGDRLLLLLLFLWRAKKEKGRLASK